MAYRYTCIKTFLADITAIHGSQAARNSFMEGILEGSLFYEMLSDRFYNVDSQELDFFNVMPACKKLVTATMNIDNCQSDLNVVKNTSEGTRVPYTPIRKALSMSLCKEDCGRRSAEELWLELTHLVGVSAGQTLDNFFLYGLEDAGIPSLLNNQAVSLRDLSANPKFSDLCAIQEPAEMAAFFEAILSGVDYANTCIFMGPILKQLIGYNKSYGTGDNCATFWSCVMSHLADRLGLSLADTQAMFITNKVFDHVVNIDPNAPTDKHAIIWVFDKSKFQQGLEDNFEFECPTDISTTHVAANISGHFTGAQFTKMGAIRMYYGMVDHAKILECEGILGESDLGCTSVDDFCLDLGGVNKSGKGPTKAKKAA